MVFPYIIEVREDVQKLDNFRKRGFNGIMKRALVMLVLDWMRLFIHKHFKRQAYNEYPEVYTKRKKRGRDPLVLTGALRKRIVRRFSKGQVRGTSKKVTLRVPFGRPPAFTEKFLRKATFIVMDERKISFKQAQRLVFSRAGYSRKAKAFFNKAIPFMSNSEAKRLADGLRKRIVEELNKTGRKRRRRIS